MSTSQHANADINNVSRQIISRYTKLIRRCTTKCLPGVLTPTSHLAPIYSTQCRHKVFFVSLVLGTADLCWQFLLVWFYVLIGALKRREGVEQYLNLKYYLLFEANVKTLFAVFFRPSLVSSNSARNSAYVSHIPRPHVALQGVHSVQ